MSHQISPPRLSTDSKRRFREYLANYSLTGGQIALLTSALEQADLAASALEVIQEHGNTYTTPAGTIKARSEVAIHRQATALSARLMKQVDVRSDDELREAELRRIDRAARGI
jgi:hypothetical protein